MEQNNPIQKNDILNINNIIFDKGDFSENEHRLFLEALILCDKNFQEMTKFLKNKNYNELILYSEKLSKYLQQKYQKKENNSFITIQKEKINEYSNEVLEEYIYGNYYLSTKNTDNSNSVDDYFIDDNKSILGLNNNNKKIFIIRKFPKYKTLIENNINNNNKNGINIPNIGNDKESRKTLINKLLNENCKEANFTKMEELAKMSEILQIINKTENNYAFNNGLSKDSSNKKKSFISSDTNNQNKINNINDNNNLGKKRNIHFKLNIDEKEKKKKYDFINDNNQTFLNNMNNFNNNNCFTNENFIEKNNNNNNNIPINLSNNFLPNHNFQFEPINNNILNNNINLFPNIQTNNMNENSLLYYFQNYSSNLNHFIPQQLSFMPPPIFNLPFPILGLTIPNINIPVINNHNFPNSLNNPKIEQNLNYMNYMNFNDNFNEKLIYLQNLQSTLNKQKNINNNNIDN